MLNVQQIFLFLDFIPAKESPLFISIFRWYTWLLFKRRFKNVWLKQEYEPCSECKTVYFLNHHSWWDGLIPFLLNEFLFKQQARALMEDKQMKEHSLFQKIGAFSINREAPKSTVTSLRYAIKSFDRHNSSLYIYPEGTITPAGSTMKFEGGLTWLHDKLEEVDFVPIAIHMHSIRHDKPELHLHIGRQMDFDKSLAKEEKKLLFEKKLDQMLTQIRDKAGFDDTEFEHFL